MPGKADLRLAHREIARISWGPRHCACSPSVSPLTNLLSTPWATADTSMIGSDLSARLAFAPASFPPQASENDSCRRAESCSDGDDSKQVNERVDERIVHGARTKTLWVLSRKRSISTALSA
jgi:hypothetical protein